MRLQTIFGSAAAACLADHPNAATNAPTQAAVGGARGKSTKVSARLTFSIAAGFFPEQNETLKKFQDRDLRLFFDDFVNLLATC
jgi:hypothetical protein